MVDWIFQNAAYTEQYHQYFTEFLNTVNPVAILEEAAALIAPYVEKDPTAFYSYDEFQTGVETLREFCRLRSQSVENQLTGGDAVDASHLQLSDMGTMEMGGGFDRAPNTPDPDISRPTGEMPFPVGGSPGGMMPPQRQAHGEGVQSMPEDFRSFGTGEARQSEAQGLIRLIGPAMLLVLGLLFASLFKPRGGTAKGSRR